MELICVSKMVSEKNKVKPKVLRIATVPVYMNIVLKGQLSYLNQYFDVVAATAYDEKHYNEIGNREGVVMRTIDLHRTISPVKDLCALFQLIRLMRKEKPQLIHSHTPKAGLLGMVAGFVCNVPVRMHTVTGLPLMGATGLKKKLLVGLEKLTYALATGVYPNSHTLKEYILTNNFTRQSKLKVLLNGSTNGVDTSIFDASQIDTKENLRSLYSITKDSFVFVFVGRIAKEKGIEELVSAFVALTKEFHGQKLQLLMIGKFERQYGLLKPEIEKFIENHSDIITPGRFDDVRPFYKLADVFVLPSYREGFPNAVLEAGAMGIPSIVTNINGCNEIIVNEKNGLIIPVQDEKALLEAMKIMLTNDAGYQNMKMVSRSNVVDKYARKNMLEALKIEYEDLLKKVKC
jgi:glycosyltransferase involved in cell wall biosynthesis